MPIGDLLGWRQIFTDDFTNDVPLGSFPAAVSAKWGAYPSPWQDTSTFGVYAPAKVVSVANGVLTKHIHTSSGVPAVAALTPRLPGTAQNGITYGRFAVRFRADSLPGYKVAWLLWPDSDDHWADGEIDFPETNLDKSSTWAFVHRTGSLGTDDQASFNVPIDLRGWHNMVIEWSPNLVVFRLDGVEVGRTAERVPTTAMHWVLQTETAMDITAPPSPSVSGDVQIDWVAAWAYDPSTADTTAPAVTIQAPAPSAVVAGAVPLAATATDAKAVLGVQFKVDGANLGPEDTSAPFEASWNTFLMNNGPHVLTAVARDDSGNVGTSAALAVTVSNIADTTPPTFTTTPCLVGCTVFPQDKANVIAVFNEQVVGVSAVVVHLAEQEHRRAGASSGDLLPVGRCRNGHARSERGARRRHEVHRHPHVCDHRRHRQPDRHDVVDVPHRTAAQRHRVAERRRHRGRAGRGRHRIVQRGRHRCAARTSRSAQRAARRCPRPSTIRPPRTSRRWSRQLLCWPTPSTPCP